MSTVATNLADVVMARCNELAECSEDPGRLTRRFLTPPMRDVHELVGGWMREIQLETRVDAAGNIVGRRSAAQARRSLLIGSHLDTVPGAGRYDGVLGVLIGLAVAQNINAQPLPFHLDVVGFSEEEGVRYGMPYLGSHALAGTFQSGWLHRQDGDGVPLGDAIHNFGLDPAEIEAATYSPDEVIGFIEPHLEQGPMLESMGVPVGVVSGIVGQSRFQLEFRGRSGHAGTTPMSGRRDALVMAAEFVQEVQSLGRQTENLRATVGRLEVVDSAPNVIPGRVRLTLEVRHADDLVRGQAIDELQALGREIATNSAGEFEILEQTSESAENVDEQLSALLAESMRHCGLNPASLVSGAGHDAVVMAQKFPVAMLFLRHPGGVSHHPDEQVERDDVATAIDVLTDFVLRLANISIPT
jgi:allantoate deiminase